MVHVTKFLGCVKLETGGIITASLHILLYGIYILLLIALLIFGDINTMFGEKVRVPAKFIIMLLTLTAYIAIIVVSYRSIKAIKIRNHRIMLEMVGAMFAIGSLCLYAFFIGLWLKPEYCLPPLIVFGIYFYFFLVVYSLYRVFRKEYEHQLELQLKA